MGFGIIISTYATPSPVEVPNHLLRATNKHFVFEIFTYKCSTFMRSLINENMKRVLKVILVIVIIVLIAIQFIRPTKNSGEEIAGNQITAKYETPQEVRQVLKVSCYDCHSNTTHYPWYFSIQPVAWMLEDHIEEGKKELNFSTFTNLPVWRQYKKFKEIGKEVKDGDMPIAAYTLMHRDAVLNADQKLLIQNWAANLMKEMETKYPADSLVKPK